MTSVKPPHGRCVNSRAPNEAWNGRARASAQSFSRTSGCWLGIQGVKGTKLCGPIWPKRKASLTKTFNTLRCTTGAQSQATYFLVSQSYVSPCLFYRAKGEVALALNSQRSTGPRRIPRPLGFAMARGLGFRLLGFRADVCLDALVALVVSLKLHAEPVAKTVTRTCSCDPRPQSNEDASALCDERAHETAEPKRHKPRQLCTSREATGAGARVRNVPSASTLSKAERDGFAGAGCTKRIRSKARGSLRDIARLKCQTVWDCGTEAGARLGSLHSGLRREGDLPHRTATPRFPRLRQRLCESAIAKTCGAAPHSISSERTPWCARNAWPSHPKTIYMHMS